MTNEVEVSAVHAPGAELAPYTGAPVEQYQAALAMTPEQAKALDDQVRMCTRAVLREGTDYGVIPGTGEDRKVLLKPGAEKLLQWFGFGFRCDRLEIDLDHEGHKHGVTYRCTVTKRIGDPMRGLLVDVTTCDGYAGYDEPKFFKSAEEAQRKAEATERMWAAKDGRVANPNKWKYLTEYRAPWNTVLKMAQKRAIVGAAVVASAASGLFSVDDEDQAPVADDGSSWYEQALEQAMTFTADDAGSKLYIAAAQAARDGLCTTRQKDHIQNRVRQRLELLKRAPVVVDLNEAAAAGAQGAAQASAQPGARRGRPAGTASRAAAKHEATDVGASSSSTADVVVQHLQRLGYAADEGLAELSAILGHDVADVNDLSEVEAKAAVALLSRCKDGDALAHLLASGEKSSGSADA